MLIVHPIMNIWPTFTQPHVTLNLSDLFLVYFIYSNYYFKEVRADVLRNIQYSCTELSWPFDLHLTCRLT